LIEVYTDGSCLGNPGVGGWAFLVIKENKLTSKSGLDKNTTNNRMELCAAIEALDFLKDEKILKIHTDSSYLKNGISSWISSWEKNNWLTSNKKPVKNKDLWIKLAELTKNKNITWEWVKAHDENKFNNMVDELARKEAESAL
jgi:ribonuclease HI